MQEQVDLAWWNRIVVEEVEPETQTYFPLDLELKMDVSSGLSFVDEPTVS